MDDMIALGEAIGRMLKGGEVIELIGDVGSGKTTLAKGIATGLGIEENVQSPSFTISKLYKGRDNVTLAHYDFYRLNEPGIMASELGETVADPNTVTVIEWAEAVKGILPDDRLSVRIAAVSDSARKVSISAGGDISKKMEDNLIK